MSISGHKTLSIFDRYNIVNEADLRDAMRRSQRYLKHSAQQRSARLSCDRQGASIEPRNGNADITRTSGQMKRGLKSRPRYKSRIFWKILVAGEGFEPPTFGL